MFSTRTGHKGASRTERPTNLSTPLGMNGRPAVKSQPFPFPLTNVPCLILHL
ncbi:protein of unknown function (plasmid) [Azospirillum baldaniorum]|uniref:Uncharacterized protein n=1 Tax=Azospirillum baldaniorum TaxID=1064539 RepID=A0A9P1JZG8_9PROT|nr:protein of unknown function [Azospirillum baldaniorum]